MYSITYMWYAVIGTIICIIVGNIVGALTGKESDKFDERLLHPVVTQMYRKMPGAKRTYSTDKNVNSKESSVKTDVTVADDGKNTEASNISEVNKVIDKNNKVLNFVHSQDKNIVKENGLTHINNSNQSALNGQDKIIDTNNIVSVKSGVSSSSSRLFDAYEPQSSPTPTRTRM